MSTSPDDRRTRRAAASVGAFIAIASAMVITAGVGILLAVILITGRHEGGRDRPPSAPIGDRFVVDVDRVLPWVIGLGILGVALLTLVGWFAARRAARPLATALALQRDFVADASHELRTPLTALSSRIQLLQRRHDRSQPIDSLLIDLRRDVDAMAELLTDLLLTASGTPAASDARTDIADAARDAVDTMSPLAQAARVRIEIEAESESLVAMPSVTASRTIVALLDNAIQHAPADSTVTVEVRTVERFVTIRVSDQGGGIAGIDPDRVFDRFARSEETGRRRGFGIGLALVKSVATRHSGTVEVERTSDAGTVFLLRLPRADRPRLTSGTE